jgi:hypothetical protein
MCINSTLLTVRQPVDEVADHIESPLVIFVSLAATNMISALYVTLQYKPNIATIAHFFGKPSEVADFHITHIYS